MRPSAIAIAGQLMKFFGKPAQGPRMPGPGVRRAAVRLEEHRAYWADTPDTSVVTRQRRRANERATFKARRAEVKDMTNRRNGPQGGSATLRRGVSA